MSKPTDPASRISAQLLQMAQPVVDELIDKVRGACASPSATEALKNLLVLAASRSHDRLAWLVRGALELARYEGRESVFADEDVAPRLATAFADSYRFGPAPFANQLAFLRQKRPEPSATWTDHLYGDHDRAFVVAGAMETELVEGFFAAVLEAAETWDQAVFAKRFDELVEKHGWSYNGGRNWRIRTIFSTNIRTSYMAGRLQQMRDPDVLKLRPYWQYVHGAAGEPLEPRPQHVAWDGLVLRHDDPWWDVHFPPNDWNCSCGVKCLSARDLKRLGKAGPDQAPDTTLRAVRDARTGQEVQYPEGIGFGWAYQPGDSWTRGLLPVLDDAVPLLSASARHLVEEDTPEPIEDLVNRSMPFKGQLMELGLPEDVYLTAFLEPFGLKLGESGLFVDKSGERIPISAELFQERSGTIKVAKRGREVFARMFAEVLMEPDEIWVGVVDKGHGPVVDRRYVRVDKERSLIIVYEMNRLTWRPLTAYNTGRSNKKPDFRGLDLRRGGKLVYSRRDDKG